MNPSAALDHVLDTWQADSDVDRHAAAVLDAAVAVAVWQIALHVTTDGGPVGHVTLRHALAKSIESRQHLIRLCTQEQT